MDRRKHYDNNKIQENLYQYEMGIVLHGGVMKRNMTRPAEAAISRASTT